MMEYKERKELSHIDSFKLYKPLQSKFSECSRKDEETINRKKSYMSPQYLQIQMRESLKLEKQIHQRSECRNKPKFQIDSFVSEKIPAMVRRSSSAISTSIIQHLTGVDDFQQQESSSELERRQLHQELQKIDSSPHESIFFGSFEDLHKQFSPPLDSLPKKTTELPILESNNFLSDTSVLDMKNICTDQDDELSYTDVDLTASIRKLVIKIKQDSTLEPTLNLTKKRRKKDFMGDVIRPGILKFLTNKKRSNQVTDEEIEAIEGARWKIIELAFRFGGRHRYYLAQAVNMFYPLTKYGRRGVPHSTRLHCNNYGTLQWQQKRGGWSDPVDLADVVCINEGRETAVFKRHSVNLNNKLFVEGCSLSLVFHKRTLDLETQSKDHRDWLFSALQTLARYSTRQRNAESQVHVSSVISKSEKSDEISLDNNPTSSTQLESICEKIFGPVAA